MRGKNAWLTIINNRFARVEIRKLDNFFPCEAKLKVKNYVAKNLGYLNVQYCALL